MDISFLVLWSICLSSPFVHFKNGPEHLTRRSAQVFIIFIRFLQYSLVSNNLFIWDTLFWIFSFISTCLTVSASNISNYFYVSFSPSILNFLDLLVPSLPSCVVCGFSLLEWRIFLCQIPSLCPDCIFTLPVLEFPILFRLWQTVWCRPCPIGDWSFSAI